MALLFTFVVCFEGALTDSGGADAHIVLGRVIIWLTGNPLKDSDP